jgi:hypothetical protein
VGRGGRDEANEEKEEGGGREAGGEGLRFSIDFFALHDLNKNEVQY